MPTTGKNILTAREIEQVKLGLDLASKIKDIKLEKVFVSPLDKVAMTPWLEVAIVAAALALKVYQATKFNEFEHKQIVTKEMLKQLDIKTQFSMNELIAARKTMNKTIFR